MGPWEGERGESGKGHAGAGSGGSGFGDSTRGLEFSHLVCLSWENRCMCVLLLDIHNNSIT